MPYKCVTLGSDVQTDNMQVTTITGFHHYRKSNQQVEKLEFNHHLWTTYLPNGFGEFFPNLIEFEVRETPLKALKRSNFAGLRLLVVLSMDDTKIASIANNTFADLSNLQELAISRSFLSTLSPNIFLPLVNLRSFDGKYNKLFKLEPNLFRENSRIELINLTGNKLYEIATDFTKLKNITEVYLFNCHCVNAYYAAGNPTFTIKEFQKLIKKRCSTEDKS